MSVRTLGLMRESASRRTIASSKTPHARPTPLVHVIGRPSQVGRVRSDLDRARLHRLRKKPTSAAQPLKGRVILKNFPDRLSDTLVPTLVFSQPADPCR